uniref:Uncharacterized protein n=1 Tax=Tanacetum cinerariifolium TaxID=118510 RepID=A0A6L2NQK8_TANCI|nr:hypothetical protein [Tanacetum cinerariifolium]
MANTGRHIYAISSLMDTEHWILFLWSMAWQGYTSPPLELRSYKIIKSRGNLLEDDIENLKRGDEFSSKDVIEMKRSDYHI